MRGVGGGVAQRLDKRMRSLISPCISSCRVFRGVSLGEILKTKNVGETISGHFAILLKSQIYLNYAYLQMFQVPIYSMLLNVFEAMRASSVGCAYRMLSRRSRVRSSCPTHSFAEIWSWNKFYGHSLPSTDSRRAVVSYWRKNVH